MDDLMISMITVLPAYLSTETRHSDDITLKKQRICILQTLNYYDCSL